MKRMPRYYENLVATTKPSQTLYRLTFRDGQQVCLWFERTRVRPDRWEESDRDLNANWNVCLYVGPYKAARRWKRRRDGSSPITGDGTLYALFWALEMVLLWRDHMGPRDMISINWTDERRFAAYRYLLRHGFELEADIYGRPSYVSRNPKYWIAPGKEPNHDPA